MITYFKMKKSEWKAKFIFYRAAIQFLEAVLAEKNFGRTPADSEQDNA